ncbi:MAG TPA: substrate-binding domain-containing protein [Pseudonocardiaceae bacterium]
MNNTLSSSPAAPAGDRSMLVGTGAVLGAVLVAAASLIALRPPDGPACTTATSLKVVAAPAVAATVQAITRSEIDASCVAVRVIARSSADTAADLAEDTDPPALWIADSAIWPALARETAATRGAAPPAIEEHPPIALSPLVVVAAPRDAERLGAGGGAPSWQELIAGPVDTTIGDPVVTTEGLSTLLVVRRLLGNPDGTPRPELVGALLTVGQDAVSSMQLAYDRMRTADNGLAFTASEQSVLAHNEAANRPDVVAVYPREGTVAMEYLPVRVSRPGEPAGTAEAARVVEEALRSSAATAALRAAGFRSPDGLFAGEPPAAAGVTAARPELVPLPRVDEAREVLRTWGAVNLDVRMLVVIDVSGSMDEAAGNGQTRIELARDAALTALGLYPDSTDVGLWAFSVGQRPPDDWVELMPMGPVGPRRQVLGAAFASLPARTDGATGLNDTVLAAVRALRGSFDARRVNTVVLLTDGRNEDPAGIAEAELLAELRAAAAADPGRPVPVMPVGLGPDVDFPALQRIAEATGGKAYLARDPADIRGAFLDAIIQRRCRPAC